MLDYLRASQGRIGFTAGKLAAVGVFLVLATASIAPAQVIYNSIPAPLPPNLPSLGFQATQTDQFGDHITFAGTTRVLSTVTIVMSDWALATDFPAYPGAGGPTWTHPITLNLFNVGANTGNAVLDPPPGTLIASRTVNAIIPWRPAADPTCPGGTAWRAADGLCYNGLAFKVTFDFTGVTVPNQIIYGVAYNTETWGAAPIGVAGPYDSLNFGLAQVPPTIGTNPDPDSAYWNTHTPGNYSDGGANGVNVFRRDTNWTPFSGAIAFDTAQPNSFQISYASNLVAGDSYVDLTNSGATVDPAGTTSQNICVNVYTYDPSEELVSCCACPVTPNGLNSLSVKQDLVSNTLTPGVPGSVVIKLIASTVPTGGACNASTVGTGTNLSAAGMLAWDTTLTQNTSIGSFETNRVPFSSATLSSAELARATTFCGFIQANGSGFGICRSCRIGALGGSQK